MENVAVVGDEKLVAIEKVCAGAEGGGIAAVGACAAVRAMAHHWKDHFAEGFGWEIVEGDLDDAIKELSRMRDQLRQNANQKAEAGLAEAA